jgi:hypothetical protein
MTKDNADPHPVLDEASAILRDLGLAHSTLQVEPAAHEGCADIDWCDR